MCVVGSSVPLGLQQEPLGAGQGGVARPGSGSNAMLSAPSPIAGEQFLKNQVLLRIYPTVTCFEPN